MKRLFDSINSVDYSSFYQGLALQELEWLGQDTEDRFKHHLETKYHRLEKFGWIDKKFTYKFNSLGFRCDEFSDKPSAMFLGCSNTLGIGLPLEDTWAQQVAKELNLECANLGIGASSPDTSFRLCLGYIDKIKPKIVIYNQPPEGRLELVGTPNHENIMLRDINYSFREKYFAKYAVEKSNTILNYLKNYYGIKSLCEERNIKFLAFDNYMTSDFCPGAPLDSARDLGHYGPLHNREFTKYVLSHM